MSNGDEVVHACPLPGSGVTGCCRRTPFDLPHTDRITLDPTLVTCPERQTAVVGLAGEDIPAGAVVEFEVDDRGRNIVMLAH